MLGLFVLYSFVLLFLCSQTKAKDNYEAEKAANLGGCSISSPILLEFNNTWPKWPQGGNSAPQENSIKSA